MRQAGLPRRQTNLVPWASRYTGSVPTRGAGGPHDILAWGGSLREQRPNAPCLASDSCPSYLEAPLPSEPQGPLPRLLLQSLELPPLCLWVTEA